MPDLLERLKGVEQRFQGIVQQMGDPAVIGDQPRFQRLAKSHADLEPVVERYRRYRKLLVAAEEAKAMLQGGAEADIRELVEAELQDLAVEREKMEEELMLLLLPRDPADEKDIILEVRAGTGGDEAALFAAELVRMYSRYAESQSWKVEVLSSHLTGVGGVKEASGATGACHGIERPDSYLDRHRGGLAGGEGGGGSNRPEGTQDRCLPLHRSRWAVCEHYRFSRADHSPADRHGGQLPG